MKIACAAAAIISAIIGVVSHAMIMFLSVLNFIAETPLMSPIPMIAPMIACEVLTGTPIIAKMCVVTAIDATAVNAVNASRGGVY